eukprot:m.177862 g.177862  ORF g.177862 m.177862 type:complete len:93 (-) comp24502_c0_seq2:58-336(-)
MHSRLQSPLHSPRLVATTPREPPRTQTSPLSWSTETSFGEQDRVPPTLPVCRCTRLHTVREVAVSIQNPNLKGALPIVHGAPCHRGNHAPSY